jgi:hypothetical protein
MSDWNFCVTDVDAGVPLAERQAYAAAQQRQLREHFSSVWDGLGQDATVRAMTPDAPVQPGEIEIRLQNTVTQSGAYAFHDAKPDGTPICYVFVGLLKQNGQGWTSAASHEVLETMGDRRLRLCVEMSDGTIWDREVCDRVEQGTYQIDGVDLSNFNTPQAFEPPTTGPAKYDWLGQSTTPNQVLPGGYAQKFNPSQGWTMVQASKLSAYRTHLLSCGLGRAARRIARNPKQPWWKRLFSALRFWR